MWVNLGGLKVNNQLCMIVVKEGAKMLAKLMDKVTRSMMMMRCANL